MAIWSAEIKELEKLYGSFKGQLPDLEKELERLTKADDENMILLYSRRCLEVIITDLCECELKRPRKTEPLKGIIDKLHKEEKVPSNIITSMDHLNSLSAYGAHPKDFDPEQVKPVLVNLDVISKWYLKYKDCQIVAKPTPEGRKYEAKQSVISPPDNSIIVLPFENISSDPEQEYFSDGLTEEIITDLSHIDDLLVISRSSAMTFKGTKKTIPEIAQAVKVRYVLEGSVRKAGDNLRITAQLIDSVTDTHLWAEKYTGILNDIFDIQETVSKKIVEALKGRLSSKDKKLLATDQYDKNVGVYDAYSRAHYEFWQYEPGCHERALHLLEDAVKAFGEHPILLSGIGAIHWQFYHQLGNITEAHLEKIKECAEKLFAKDAESAQGHRLTSYIDLHNGDVNDAIRHLYKAMECDPGDTETLLWLSYLLIIHAGQPDLAKPVAERWMVIDPLQPLSKMSMRLIEWMTGDFESAIKGLREWKKEDPENPIPSFYLGHIFAWTGYYDESLMLAEEMFRQDPDEAMGQALRFITYSLHGEVEKAKNVVTPSTKEWMWMDFHLPWLIAEGFSILGEKDEALLWLERAVEKGLFNYPMLNTMDPLIENIRSEERFKKLMERVKYEWENFEV